VPEIPVILSLGWIFVVADRLWSNDEELLSRFDLLLNARALT